MLYHLSHSSSLAYLIFGLCLLINSVKKHSLISFINAVIGKKDKRKLMKMEKEIQGYHN